jgi:hypothetical protein
VHAMDVEGAEGSMPTAAGRLVALRAATSDRSSAWWQRATAARATAPLAIRALLSGRQRVELTRREADAALAWASLIADSPDGPADVPLVVYDPHPV